MQIIQKQSLREYMGKALQYDSDSMSFTFPLDKLLSEWCLSNQCSYYDPKSSQKTFDLYKLPMIHFRHSIAFLDPQKVASVQYLVSVYHSLLISQGFSLEEVVKCSIEIDLDSVCFHRTAYNLILTESYSMIIPRSSPSLKLNSGIVNINSFGFLGFFMTSNDVIKDDLKEYGLMQALESVGIRDNKV